MKIITKNKIPNRYPVYVVSKGRYDNALTFTALQYSGVPFKVIVEEFEYKKYSDVVGSENVLVLPKEHQENYDKLDSFGMSKSVGPGPARNFAWDHSIKNGFKWHWVLDDNLYRFHLMHNNVKPPVKSNATFRAAEDFVDRYENLAIAGMNYYSFAKATDAVPPLKFNTRIYSCLLIRNDIPYRWRGRYNEDTILSLDVLKDGWATCQFNAFLCGKTTTQRMTGGNTEEFYEDEGTLPKSQMLADIHPDVSKVVWRFNRWHHQVNYKPFEKNDPKIKTDLTKYNKIDNYGLILKDVGLKQAEELKELLL